MPLQQKVLFELSIGGLGLLKFQIDYQNFHLLGFIYLEMCKYLHMHETINRRFFSFQHLSPQIYLKNGLYSKCFNGGLDSKRNKPGSCMVWFSLLEKLNQNHGMKCLKVFLNDYVTHGVS